MEGYASEHTYNSKLMYLYVICILLASYYILPHYDR